MSSSIPPTHDHPDTPPAEHHEGGHGNGGPHKKHGKDHGGHGGGHGHGGAWLVTYCDMITLLVAMFICIVTFASKNQGQHPRRKDSLLYGQGGSGIAGPVTRGQDREAILWRQVTLADRFGEPGGSLPPMYSDPAIETTAIVLKKLEEASDKTLGDNYMLSVPVGLILETDKRVSSAGQQILQIVARNVRNLPYSIQVQVNGASELPQAVFLARYLAEKERLPPNRIAAGIRPQVQQLAAQICFVFVRNAS